MKRYDIFLAEVPFDDVEGSKVRPVLILDERVYLISCLSITSNTSRPEDYVIRQWKEAGLRKPSSIRILKELELEPSMLDRRIGSLQPIDIIGLQNRL